MKLFSKVLFLSLALFATFALTSCGDDDNTCSDCPAYTLTDGGISIESPAAKICVGDDDGVGGTITQAQVDAFTQLAESAGVSCN